MIAHKINKIHDWQGNADTLPIIQHSTANQTIIVNKQKFGMTYMYETRRKKQKHLDRTINEHRKSRKTLAFNNINKNKDQKKQTLGFDNWILNKNLKQFGQTRHYGFFQNNDLSPYVTHRAKKVNSTQRHESYLKNRELQHIYDDINFNKRNLNLTFNQPKLLSKTRSNQQQVTLEFNQNKIKLRKQLNKLEAKQGQFHHIKIQNQLKNELEGNNKNGIQNQSPAKKNILRINKFGNQKMNNKNQQNQIQQQKYYGQQQQITPNTKQIDKTLQIAFEAYFVDDINIKQKSKNDIEMYLSKLKQPNLKHKQNQFVSKMKQQKNSPLLCQFRFDQQSTRINRK